MKAKLFSPDGALSGDVELPQQFQEVIRPDLIKRAVLALQSHRMQPHGVDPDAGKKYSSKLSRRRRAYKGAYGIGISRVPRKILSHRGTRFNWMASTAPNTVGGMEAHPPQTSKNLSRGINIKERRKAIRSALAASVTKEFVAKRGHLFGEYPLALENAVEDMKKTKEVLALLRKIGFEKELERSAKKTERTGDARRRGRAYKKRKGPLFVVSKKCSLMRSALNIPGVEIVEVSSLNAELLAPGAVPGRLTLYTKAAIERLGKEGLFTDSVVKVVEKGPDVKAEKPKAVKKPRAPKKEKPVAEK